MPLKKVPLKKHLHKTCTKNLELASHSNRLLLLLFLFSVGLVVNLLLSVQKNSPMPDAKNTQPAQVETDPIKIAIPLVKQNEGFKSKAYYDKLGKVWTIGTGITRYSDGTPVKEGDVISAQKNDEELY
jgi:hypothetical protein